MVPINGNMVPISAPTLLLLNNQIDSENSEDSHFRFLVDDSVVKYVSIAPGTFDVDDMTFEHLLFSLLPAFPAGNWNRGHVARNDAGIPAFIWVFRAQLPALRSQWHPVSIDHLELDPECDLFGSSGHVADVTCPRFQHPLVVKFARFEWEIPIIDNECAAYQWIDGQGIGPRFLGLLTEEGRAIGFLMERIEDAKPAEPQDLAMCQQVLFRLHVLGILHGNINKLNFLIRGGRATLIDFKTARRVQDRSLLEEEMNELPDALALMSGEEEEVEE